MTSQNLAGELGYDTDESPHPAPQHQYLSLEVPLEVHWDSGSIYDWDESDWIQRALGDIKEPADANNHFGGTDIDGSDFFDGGADIVGVSLQNDSHTVVSGGGHGGSNTGGYGFGGLCELASAGDQLLTGGGGVIEGEPPVAGLTAVAQSAHRDSRTCDLQPPPLPSASNVLDYGESWRALPLAGERSARTLLQDAAYCDLSVLRTGGSTEAVHSKIGAPRRHWLFGCWEFRENGWGVRVAVLTQGLCKYSPPHDILAQETELCCEFWVTEASARTKELRQNEIWLELAGVKQHKKRTTWQPSCALEKHTYGNTGLCVWKLPSSGKAGLRNWSPLRRKDAGGAARIRLRVLVCQPTNGGKGKEIVRISSSESDVGTWCHGNVSTQTRTKSGDDREMVTDFEPESPERAVAFLPLERVGLAAANAEELKWPMGPLWNAATSVYQERLTEPIVLALAATIDKAMPMTVSSSPVPTRLVTTDDLKRLARGEGVLFILSREWKPDDVAINSFVETLEAASFARRPQPGGTGRMIDVLEKLLRPLLNAPDSGSATGCTVALHVRVQSVKIPVDTVDMDTFDTVDIVDVTARCGLTGTCEVAQAPLQEFLEALFSPKQTTMYLHIATSALVFECTPPTKWETMTIAIPTEDLTARPLTGWRDPRPPRQAQETALSSACSEYFKGQRVAHLQHAGCLPSLGVESDTECSSGSRTWLKRPAEDDDCQGLSPSKKQRRGDRGPAPQAEPLAPDVVYV